MHTHLFPLILFLGISLAGCQSDQPEIQGEETTGPTNPSADIIAAYRPRVVKLIEVYVNSTVAEPFPDNLYPQRHHVDNWVRFERLPIAQFYEQNRTPPYTLENKTVMSHDLTHLWRVQDNDTIVLGQSHLVSNKHDIIDRTMSIAPQHSGSAIHVGGMDFSFSIAGEGLISAFYGPYTPGSLSDDAPFRDGFPLPIRNSIKHDSRFPMLGSDQHTITYPVAPVITNLTIRYWGNARFVIPDDYLEPYRDDPSELDSLLEKNALDFEPLGRFGQVALTCGQTPRKTYDPCMDRWEHPLT